MDPDAELRRIVAQEFMTQGGMPSTRYGWLPHIKAVSRKLTGKYDTLGWPQTRQEVEADVRNAVSTYV